MNTQNLQKQFDAIGAWLVVHETQTLPRRVVSASFGAANDFTLDIGHDRKGEFFSLAVQTKAMPTLDLLAADVRPGLRHLLMLAKRLDGPATEEKRKFLCGHDERHWFVAAIPDARSVAHVYGAMEALKPAVARISQHRQGVRAKDWHRRWNAGFVRQGEWFFLPRPEFRPTASDFILHDEPIRRAGGKPHQVEHLVRNGGTTVYVGPRYPNGLTQAQYDALLARKPSAQSWPWRVMRRNPQVYACGKIRHPDHATLILPFWHAVVMSAEQSAANVAFLD